jgi:lysophospholipase L1-like esterase
MPVEMHDVVPYLRGLVPGLSWAERSRVGAEQSRKLPWDTGRAARVPAGVHLAVTGTARAVDLAVEVGEPTTVPAPTLAAAFLVRATGATTAAVPVPTASGTVRVPLPERAPDEVVRVYLPESVELGLTGLTPVDGTLDPVVAGPRWVVHGDSICQGWSVTEAGGAWPSLVAQDLGLDLVNLGFAGSARGELAAADVVAGSGAAAVAIAWGTTAYSSLPTDAPAIAETTRLFLTAVRQGLPLVPIVVVSPIVRPAAERVPNRFGATLADLRTAQEDAVRRFAETTGDERITLVPGLDLLPPERLPDGIHPDDEGHRLLAAALAPHVSAGLTVAELAAGAVEA